MRRIRITLSAALVLLAIAPVAATARHHDRRHHHRRHARIEHFGRDASTSSSSAESAGTIQKFSGGVLTIMLGDGSAVSGKVNRDTELECMAPTGSQTTHEDGDRDGGDQSGDGGQGGSRDDQADGSGEQSTGDDQGDTAEQNENQAEDNDNEAAEQNENEAESGSENENEAQSCSPSNLTGGRTVREAALRITSAGGVWRKIELGS